MISGERPVLIVLVVPIPFHLFFYAARLTEYAPNDRCALGVVRALSYTSSSFPNGEKRERKRGKMAYSENSSSVSRNTLIPAKRNFNCRL